MLLDYSAQILDAGVAGARWDSLFWDETPEILKCYT